MKIVIDLQGAQSESKYRGIGRFSLDFTYAFVKNAKDKHDIYLLLNEALSDSIESIREKFKEILPEENIKIFNIPTPTFEENPHNSPRARVAELIREYFIAQLNPDFLIITSLFEGFVDDSIISIGELSKTKTAVILYDLIPYLDHKYLSNEIYKQFYLKKTAYLKKADVLLAISESSKEEAVHYLNFKESKIQTIYGAVDSMFCRIKLNDAALQKTKTKYNIENKFLMYAPGGFDHRKNFANLIEAYSLLPENIKKEYQLVIVGKIPEGNRKDLKSLAKQFGLKNNDLILTGYISDKDLITLYNLTDLFIFPSLHEGFGLPALEAINCGAVVIGSNTTSIPEVIGCKEALFNPKDPKSIAKKIEEVLLNDEMRKRIYIQEQQHKKSFSWDKTAKQAIDFLERQTLFKNKNNVSFENLILNIAKKVENSFLENDVELRKIAQVIHHNNQALYEKQLFIDISELHFRDANTGVQRVTKGYLYELLKNPPKGYKVVPVYATVNEGYRYANKFTAKFMGKKNCDHLEDLPISWNQGDIFFGLDMQHHVHLSKKEFFHQLKNDGVIVKFMIHDLLPIELPEMFKDNNHNKLHEELMKMFAQFDGVVCVSNATSTAYKDFLKNKNITPLAHFQNDWVHNGVIADKNLLKNHRTSSSSSCEVINKLQERATFLCVSTIEPRKKQDQIFEAFELLWDRGYDINLVFVGKQGWKVEELIKKITNSKEYKKRLFWLSGIDDEYLKKIYETSTCLIAASINEGFGLPLIEAAQYGLPIIARDIDVFREVAGNHAYYFNGFKPIDLADAIEEWLKLYKKNKHPQSNNMPFSTWKESTKKLKTFLINSNKPKKSLFLDISELVQKDAKSGIQRVVRSILLELIKNPPKEYDIKPIYATVDDEYRYATNFIYKFLGHEAPQIEEKYIEYKSGDVFFILDMQPAVQISKKEYYDKLRNSGVKVAFLLYDILSINMPEFFPEGNKQGFETWLNVMSEQNQVVCISHSVEKDYINWLKTTKKNTIKTNWFHLGADIQHSKPTKGFPKNAKQTLDNLKNKITFLMVGTLEPRKGHMQTLKAFTKLWENGLDVNLVIVGKKGWKIDEVVSFIENHSELNKKLFWLNGISDEYLEKIYKVSDCLIAASEGEGFGLPLIEAAQHKLPIIARDIPVFREIAGEHAYYFENSKDPDVLANAIEKWIDLYNLDKHPKSDNMPYLTWRESVNQLKKILGVS